ncbi:MAG TPA: ABC transporter ATP-binding protein [Stellaceae bacterium]|nr:ABC transporter ATP-binding protein [Stellaceae bacterium]
MSAKGLAIDGLTLRLGAFSLKSLDLAVAEGETLVLLGPNGAGKSVTLETIAGFYRPSAGRISIGGRDVTGLPPERRNVALVLQNFGLFPHLSVKGNIALGLRRSRDAAARGRLARLLDEFAIRHLADRAPASLSPGEKQRTALARALAAEPDLFLFDEPFSALDAETRERLRGELREFLARAGTPSIFVTHDRADALAFGGGLAVMHGGRVVQQGNARAVFGAPRDRFVAEFLGVENILAARLLGRSGAHVTLLLGEARLHAVAPERLEAGPEVLVAIRAEEVEFAPSGVAPHEAANRLAGHVRGTVEEGVLTRVRLDCGFPLTGLLMSREARRLNLGPRSVVEVEIPCAAIRLLPTAASRGQCAQRAEIVASPGSLRG